MRISGKIRVTGLFGYPVEHTLSPVMQNAAFEHLEIDCCYLPFSVHPDALKQAIESIRALSFLGVNLTIPHKEAAIPFLDVLDNEAKAIGAVNTIVTRDGKLIGYNTDGKGFMRSLDENLVNVSGKQVLIIGAGGSSRAIGYHLSRKAGSLSLYNRSRDKADAVAAYLSAQGGPVTVIDSLSDMSVFDIIINATSLGLNAADPLPFDVNLLTSSQTVCDLIYHKTQLCILAEALGCKTIGGTGMLLWQGALAFELWTGSPPPLEIMRSALLNNPA